MDKCQEWWTPQVDLSRIVLLNMKYTEGDWPPQLHLSRIVLLNMKYTEGDWPPQLHLSRIVLLSMKCTENDWPPSRPFQNCASQYEIHRRWLTPKANTRNFKFQIWPGHEKMTDPSITENFKFQIWPDHGPTTTTTTNFKFQIWHQRTITFSLGDFYTKDILFARVTL